MDNKRSAVFKKCKLATAIAIASISVGVISGCADGDRSVSTTGGTFTKVTMPTGKVTGHVEDTNGSPVEGATVYLAGQTTTTDAGGQYIFNSVSVVNTSGADDSIGQELVVQIVPPEAAAATDTTPAGVSMLSATVTVTPQAQIDGSQQTDSANDEVTDSSQTNPVTTFIDGFLASAGTAILPILDAGAKGVLRDSLTGEPVAGATLFLDFYGVDDDSEGDTSGDHNDRDARYQSISLTTTSGTDGSFEFANIPSDGYFELHVEDHAIVENGADDDRANNDTTINDTDQYPFYTGEGVVNNLGTVAVEMIESIDQENPWVTGVNGVLASNEAVRGMLNDDLDGTQGLVIKFSEPMDTAALDTNSVIVVTDEAHISATAAYAADGMSVTVTTATAIPVGTDFRILLLVDDFRDTGANEHSEGNDLVVNNAANDTTVDYDFNETVAGATYIELRLKTFEEPNRSGDAVTVAQESVDAFVVDRVDLIQDLSTSFNDVDGIENAVDLIKYNPALPGTPTAVAYDGSGIQQLNAEDDDDMDTDIDVEGRLEDLADEQLSESGVGGTLSVEADVARINFAHVNASSYRVLVTRSAANIDIVGATAVSIGSVFGVDGDIATVTHDDSIAFEFEPDTDIPSIALILKGVEPGDNVTVVSMDDFGIAVNTSTALTLIDNVPPTTILQTSYDWGDEVVASVVPDFGDGGELSQTGSKSAGAPYLAITPRLLTTPDWAGDSDIAAYRESVFANDTTGALNELFIGNQTDTDAASATFGDRILSTGDATYDSIAFAAYIAGDLSRTVGVAMSEDVALTGTPTTTGISATIDNYTVHNDVTQQDDGDVNNVDLVQVDVSNVLTLANTDFDGEIDFSAAMTDTAATPVAATNANAKVVIQDRMPPFVSSASYDGDTMTVNFNESVSVEEGDELEINGQTITISEDTAVAHALQVDRTVLTLSLANGDYGNMIRTARFNLGAYEESGANIGQPGSNSTTGHGELFFGDIEDDQGNEWDDYWFSGEGFLNTTGLNFAMIDNTGAMTATVTDGTFTDAVTLGNAFTVTYNLSHRVDLVGLGIGLAADATSMSAAEVAACFTLTSAATIDVAVGTNTGATISTNGRTIAVTVEVATNGLTAADTFDLTCNGGDFDSAWDSTDDVDPATSTAP